MESITRDIEEISTDQKLYHMTYSKKGLYIAYPFLALMIFVVIVLFVFQRDVVIELTGTISNSETGWSISPVVSGEIVDIAVANYQEVKDGDIIMMLDTSDIEQDIYWKEADIEELERHLVYLNHFETSIVEGKNLLPSDAFGYSLRVEQHFRTLENAGVELNHLTRTRDENVANVSGRMSSLESLVLDYQNFRRLVNGLTYDTISDDVVRVKAQQFRENLANFDDESSQEKSAFIASTRLQIEQNISNLQDEIRLLNEELLGISRSFENESVSIDQHELSVSQALMIEIFDLRENVLDQTQEAERQLELLRDKYEEHTITAPADGHLQFAGQLALGESINARAEIGRIMNLDSVNNYIISHFSSADFNRVSLGQNVTFILTDGDNNRQLVSGKIELISEFPTHTEQGNLFTLHASINSEDSDLTLRYGMTGELNIITGRTSIIRYLINRFF